MLLVYRKSDTFKEAFYQSKIFGTCLKRIKEKYLPHAASVQRANPSSQAHRLHSSQKLVPEGYRVPLTLHGAANIKQIKNIYIVFSYIRNILARLVELTAKPW